MIPRRSLSTLLTALCITALAWLLSPSEARAQGTAVITGTVVDAGTKKPVADVVITATSPALQGEQTVVSDKSGSYRIPNLPPGTYTLRFEAGGYRPSSKGDITLKVDATRQVNVELLPQGIGTAANGGSGSAGASSGRGSKSKSGTKKKAK